MGQISIVFELTNIYKKEKNNIDLRYKYGIQLYSNIMDGFLLIKNNPDFASEEELKVLINALDVLGFYGQIKNISERLNRM